MPTTCRLCRSDLPAADAVICPECGKSQTSVQEWVERHSVFVGSVKLILSALLIPGLLWLVAIWHDKREKERDATNAKYSEIVAALPRIDAAHALLYDPCVGTNSESCAASVDEALGDYLKAESEFGQVIVRHFPDLNPSVVLLSSLNRQVTLEVSSLWQDYFVCAELYTDNVLGCADERRRFPISSLQISGFIIDFLECEARLRLAKASTSGSEYCQAIVEARKEVVLKRPSQALTKFDGFRPPLELLDIQNAIWSDHLVPGSDLGRGHQRVEPTKVGEEVPNPADRADGNR